MADYAEIPLTRGQFAIVDVDDYDWLNRYKWCAKRDRHGFYAFRTERHNGRKRGILMHRMLMDAKPGEIIDHINGNGLDNRRSNLRRSNPQFNMANCRRSWGSSVFKGVRRAKTKGVLQWEAQIRVDGRPIYLGTFPEEWMAALAYDAAALKYFGEHARPNIAILSERLLDAEKGGVGA